MGFRVSGPEFRVQGLELRMWVRLENIQLVQRRKRACIADRNQHGHHVSGSGRVEVSGDLARSLSLSISFYLSLVLSLSPPHTLARF